MSKLYPVVVMGATGAVGLEMIKTLEQRDFPMSELRLLASSRSAGKKLKFKGKDIEVEELTENSFKGGEIVLASAGGSISKKFAPIAAAKGSVVIDNTSAFRMDKDVPLVVPECNPHQIKNHKGIIANPNCSTIQMVVALKPIHDAAKIKRVVVATYQSVSGKGLKAIEELENQVKAYANNEAMPAPKEFPYQIAFECLPHIDDFLENGYTKEEMKMTNETMKILEDDSIKVTATCVRVPVTRAHSEAVNIETEKKLTADDVRKLLSTAPGVVIVDDPANNKYPLAKMGEDRDETFVGRIREDVSCENGIEMWVVSDNIRKGAALNAVQIAEIVQKEDLVAVTAGS
jgi:aspartate-semialdehyde dehydrogenase